MTRHSNTHDRGHSATGHFGATTLLRRIARGGRFILPLLLLTGCGGSSNDVYIRVLNVSMGYTALDVYDGDTSVTTTPAIEGTTTGTVSSYAGIATGSSTLYFTTEGETQTDDLTSETETFSQNEHRTYVAYGDTGEFGYLEINENQATPSSGNASVEVLNTATDAGAVDVYLTTSSVALTSVSPTFSDVAVGKASSFSTLPDGTYDLSVVGTGNPADVRLQVTGLALTSEEVVSIVIAESSGGYLVNAYILPQQGSLTTALNPDARVRAVTGVSSGTVTATVGSTALLSSAAPATIGTYQLVPAETETVAVTVGGAAVASPSETLAAGQDYTLLLYTSSGATAENWLVDTNDLPLSGYASVRLVDAMSGLTDPLSMTMDYVPVATDVALGDASSYDTEVTQVTSNGVVSVTDATTAATVYTNSTITLNQGVYTMFMFGSAASPVGVMNEDRQPPSN